MRIEAYTQVQQLYKTNGTAKNEKTKSASQKDQLQISDKAKDYQVAKQSVANVPDIREDIAAPIKAAVQNGTYEVDSESFAAKLLEKYNQSGQL